jgi:Colicin/Pyocin-S2, DNase domain
MPSIWDLLPASAWPVQPFVWPLDPMRPPPWPQTVSPQPSASSAPAFGWAPAPAAAASAPAFGWASASPAPPSAPAYSGAPDPDAFLGAFPHAEVDPARTARLAEDARRAYEFTRWAFGPPSRPAGQTRAPAAGPDEASRFAPTAAAAAAVDAPPRSGATSGIDDAGSRPATPDVPVPANWADQWDAPVVNPDAAPVGAVSDPPAPPVPPLDQDPIAATPPARSLWDRIGSGIADYLRWNMMGSPGFAPGEIVNNAATSVADAGRIMTTPALPPPRGARAEDDEGRTWSRGTADPVEWEAFVADNQARTELPMRIALAMLTGGAGFAERGALGVGGGRLEAGRIVRRARSDERRFVPGEGAGAGVKLEGRWQLKDEGPVPAQVADLLRGRKFSSMRQYREAFWKEVANIPELAREFNPQNRALMALGKAPKAISGEHLGKTKMYHLHHVEQVKDNGNLYNADNIRVVSPRRHDEIHTDLRR